MGHSVLYFFYPSKLLKIFCCNCHKENNNNLLLFSLFGYFSNHREILLPPHPWAIFRPIFQSALRGRETTFLDFFFMGATAQNKFKRTKISGMVAYRYFK